jgi:hypothetical protein
MLDLARLIATDRPDALADAVELFRGDFLDSITINDTPDLALWLLQERARWR